MWDSSFEEPTEGFFDEFLGLGKYSPAYRELERRVSAMENRRDWQQLKDEIGRANG